MWRRDRRKWKRVNWSGLGVTEIDSGSETKSRAEWVALESASCEEEERNPANGVCSVK